MVNARSFFCANSRDITIHSLRDFRADEHRACLGFSNIRTFDITRREEYISDTFSWPRSVTPISDVNYRPIRVLTIRRRGWRGRRAVTMSTGFRESFPLAVLIIPFTRISCTSRQWRCATDSPEIHCAIVTIHTGLRDTDIILSSPSDAIFDRRRNGTMS